MNSAYSIVERAASITLKALSNPVLFGYGDRRNKIITQYLVPPASPPTKYRRYPEYRKGCFIGRTVLAQRVEARENGWSGCRCAERPTCIRFSSTAHKAALSGRPPKVDRGCIRNGAANSGESLPYDWVSVGAATGVRPPFTHATSQGRCFRYKRRIGQNAGLNKPVVRVSSPEGSCLNILGRLREGELTKKHRCRGQMIGHRISDRSGYVRRMAPTDIVSQTPKKAMGGLGGCTSEFTNKHISNAY